MAALFLSYQHNDEALAKGLELRLASRGHVFRIKVGAKVPGDFRLKLMNALEESDAVVILLSERGLSSQYVLGQVGSARVLAKTKGMLILPVVVGKIGIPKCVSDIQCYELATHTEKELDELAEELNQAICDHCGSATRAPRIFVSHRHKDEPIAAALVSLLEAAFHIEKTDIRCTSVQPYTLPSGEQVSERLRRDVVGAQVVIGLLGPETAESRYVLFELGAAWGHGVPAFPALVRGASAKDVPGPLKERHSVSLEDTQNCVQVIDDIAAGTTLRRRDGVAGRVASEARKLAKVAQGSKKGRAKTAPRKRAAHVPQGKKR